MPIISRSLGDKSIKAVYSGKQGEDIRNVDTRKKDRRRFVLKDEEAVQLARWGKIIEDHYENPMDIEWARDGKDDAL